jgi:hypothetical protein
LGRQFAQCRCHHASATTLSPSAALVAAPAAAAVVALGSAASMGSLLTGVAVVGALLVLSLYDSQGGAALKGAPLVCPRRPAAAATTCRNRP